MLKTIKLSLAVSASLLMLCTAPAASAQQNYWVLKAIPSLKPAGGAGSGPVAPKVELAAGLLPDGMEGKPYSFDLKTLTQVTAGPGIGSVQYALAGGTLPTGVSLSNDGMLAGTPTTFTAPEGASFTVVGTYVTATGQQTYTIKVGELVLDAVQISTSNYHTCAVTTAGAAKCWGYNNSGQLGDGTRTDRRTPVTVTDLSAGVANIWAGNYHTCAVTMTGAAKCWGLNGTGRLGNGSTTSSNTPVAVSGLSTGVASIAVGQNHTCAVTTTGSAKCWGGNSNGKLGDGTTTDSSTPVTVSGLSSGVVRISVGSMHTCAVTAAGAAHCWGYNSNGQLGDGTTSQSLLPVQVLGLTSGVSSLSAGNNHTCAVVAGVAKCWGSNMQGQLGDGATINSSVPVQVTGLTSGVSSIAAGSTHTCAVTTTGAAKCWGQGGRLGDGTSTASSTPVTVSGLSSGVESISTGAGTCAVTMTGESKCWGMNSYGQLGNGTTTSASVPVTVKAGN